MTTIDWEKLYQAEGINAVCDLAAKQDKSEEAFKAIVEASSLDDCGWSLLLVRLGAYLKYGSIQSVKSTIPGMAAYGKEVRPCTIHTTIPEQIQSPPSQEGASALYPVGTSPEVSPMEKSHLAEPVGGEAPQSKQH